MARTPTRWKPAARAARREHHFSQRHLQGILDGELDEHLTRRILRHILHCGICQGDIRAFREVRTHIGNLAMGMDPMAAQRARAHLNGLGIGSGA